MVLVSSLGQCGRKFRSQTTGRSRAIVSELYSAPRVTATATRNPRLGLMPGMALEDLTTTNSKCEPWDFNDPAKLDEAEKLLDEQRPHLMIGSPMCIVFSKIQNFNKSKRDPKVAPQMVLPPVSTTDRQRCLLPARTPEARNKVTGDQCH